MLLSEILNLAIEENGTLTEVQRRMTLRRAPNDGTRTLLESVNPEVAEALKDWAKARVEKCALVGGQAYNYWARPRATDDADFLFISYGDVPLYVEGFKKTRPHAFMHKKTHVEIEILDPSHVKGMSQDLAKKIIDSAEERDGIKVASKEALIASKLKRFSMKDQGDAFEMLKLGAKLDSSWLDLLDEEQKKNYQKLLDELAAGRE